MPYDYIEEYQKQDDETIWEFRDKNAQAKIDTSLTETDYANPLSLETMQAQHAKNTKIKLDPIQDLHGYDKPWVGGAGKNKLDTSDVTVSGISFNEDSEHYISASPNNTDTRSWSYSASQYKFTLPAGSYKLVAEVKTVTAESASRIRLYDSSETMLFDEGDALKSVGTKSYDFTLSASADIGFIAKQYESVARFMIIASNETTSYAPYENICPISGHDQIDILGCGANIWDGSYSEYTKYLDVNGNLVANNAFNVTDFIPVISEAIYSLLTATISNSPSICWYDKNKNFISGQAYGNVRNIIVNLPNNAKYVKFSVVHTTPNYQLELASSATDYEPYTESNDLSINFPSTVYGGVLDLESGELVIDKAKRTFTGNSSEGWSYAFLNNLNTFNATLSDGKMPVSGSSQSGMTNLFNVLQTNSLSAIQDNAIYISLYTLTNLRATVLVCKNDITDVNDFKTWLSSNNLELVYPLSTPTTIYLTPHQLSLLKAQNNLTTSQYTQVKVTYRNGVFATLEPATDLTDGLMSAMDKLKLDNIVPATTTTDGLMTATDKTKLDGVATNATKTESSTTNGNIKINGTETQVYDDSEIKGELTTDTTTIEGNPLNFTTLSAQTAKSTILSCEPIQDLHGYDKPWVGGARKNLFNPSFTSPSSTIEITNKTDGSIDVLVKNSIPTTFIKGNTISLKAGVTYTLSCVGATSNFSVSIRDSEASEVYAYVMDGTSSSSYTPSSDMTAWFWVRLVTSERETQNLKPQLEIGASKTTFEPYENICPISGRSEIGILGCGDNLITSMEYGGFTNDGLNGTTNYQRNRTPNYISVKENQTYKILVSGTQDKIYVSASFYDKNDFTTPRIGFTNWAYADAEITTPAGTKYIRVTTKKDNDADILINSYNIALEEVNTDLTISLGQTVYGGTLDVENGEMTITDGVTTYNGSENWAYSSGWSDTDTNVFYASYIPNALYDNATKVQLNSNLFEGLSRDDLYNDKTTMGISFSGTYSEPSPTVRIFNSITADLAAFKTWLGNNNLQVLYELATPITINLTPHTINLLKGVNSISTDGDSITLTYRDGSVATLGDLTSAVDNLDSKIDQSKILTDTATGDKYILVVTNGVLSVEQISN